MINQTFLVFSVTNKFNIINNLISFRTKYQKKKLFENNVDDEH